MNESSSRSGIAEKLSFLPLVGLVALAPIFFLPSTSFPFEATKIALIACGILLTLCLYVVARIERQDAFVPMQPALLVVWLLPLVYGISALWNGTGGALLAFNGLETDSFYFITLCAIALTVTSLVVTTKQRVMYLWYAAVAACAVLTVFQLLRLVAGIDFLSFGGLFSGTASNLLGKWNEIGILYGLAASLSLCALTMRVSPTAKVLSGGVLAVSLFFLVLVNLNVAWTLLSVVALCVFVGGLWSTMQRKGRAERSLLSTFLAAVIFLGAAYFALPPAWVFSDQTLAESSEPRNFLAERFGIVYLEARPSFDGTVATMKSVYQESPVFGSGPGSFMYKWLETKPLDINRTIFWNVDFQSGVGFIMTSLVTTGIMGLFAWFVMLGMFLYAGLRAFVLRKESVSPNHGALLAFVAAAYLFVASIFYTLGPVLLILAFIFAGVFFALTRDMGIATTRHIRFEDNPRFGFVATLVAIVIFLASAATMFFVGTSYVAAAYFQQALLAFNVDGDTDRALELGKLSSTFSTTGRADRLLSSAELSKVQQVLNDTSISAEEARAQFEQHFNAALTYAERAVDAGPNDYQNWLLLGRVTEVIVPLGNTAAYEKAVGAYDRALALNPQNPVIYYLRGNLELLNNNMTEAKKFIELSLAKKADYTEAIFLLAQMQITEGNVKDAIRSVEQAAAVEPRNPVLFFQLGLLYYSENRMNDAGAAFERAVAINQDYANAHYFLGLTLHNLKRNQEAIGQFQEVLRTNPDNEDVKKIIQNLEAGKAPFVAFDPPQSDDIEDLAGLPIEER